MWYDCMFYLGGKFRDVIYFSGRQCLPCEDHLQAVIADTLHVLLKTNAVVFKRLAACCVFRDIWLISGSKYIGLCIS